MPVHVPLLLGRLQLPAGASHPPPRDRGQGPRGAGPHPQDRSGLDRGLRPSGDRGPGRRPGRPGLRGLGGLTPPGRPHAPVRLQAGGHGRVGAHPGPRVRQRPDAPGPEQAVHQRRHPGPGRLDLRERRVEPQALLHGGPALRRALGRRGDRPSHRADPRVDAHRRPFPRPDRPHPPLGERLRAQARHPLPVAADGEPQGDRPQAAAAPQGLRTDTERQGDLQERAQRRPPVAAGPRRPAGGRCPGDRLPGGRRLGPRGEGGRPGPGLLPVPGSGPRRGPALGRDRQRRQQGLLPARAGQEPEGGLLAPLPRGPGLHPVRRLHRLAQPGLPAPD